jgi:protein SCO1/2
MDLHHWRALGAALLVTVAACASPDRREYALRGQVLSVAPDRLETTIDHEAIPGFMAAMAMPYKVRDARELDGLAPGDLVSATLVIVRDGAYLTGVSKRGSAPLPEQPPSVAPAASSGFELLKPGELVPNTRFVDEDGRTREFAAFKGSPVVLTFIYTSCPIPTFCPLMDRHFKTIQERLAADAALARVRLATVSFDPVTDTPAVLKQHAARLGADPARWTFLTGDRDEIDRFAMRFGVSIARQPDDPLDIAHNLRTALIDAEGRLVRSYTGNEWRPEQILEDLKPVAGAQ